MFNAPWYNSPIEDLAFTGYVLEEEGVLPTHKGKLNRLAKSIIEGDDINLDNLTELEIDYIEKRIRERS